MKENECDGTIDTNNPALTGGISQRRKDGVLTVRGNDRRHADNAAMRSESHALEREKLVTVREDSAQLRENLVHTREETATSREVEICLAETEQAASDDHMLLLQHVNERLVIATIEAQELAEKLKIAQVLLEDAKQAAEKANHAKSNFLSNMSHELRTPLNAILGFSQLLEMSSPLPTPIQTERLQQITKAGWYLLELINEILDLATIESGKLTLLVEPVLLGAIIHESQAMIEPQAQQHSIQMNFLPCDHTWVVSADQKRLKQVLINLLSNSIKYNREHGAVEVVCTAPTQKYIRISIKDTGIGLSQEKLAQLFQPFNRLGQEIGTEEGTGIGLVVTKQLIELMGGNIGVNSKVGVGSEFWVELLRDTTPQFATENSMNLAANPYTK